MTAHLWNLIAPSLEKYANNAAWLCRQKHGKTRFTYQKIYQASLCTAQQLRKSGIQNGDTVAIIANNGPQWTVAALACWRLNAIVAPIHIGASDYEINQQITAISPQCILLSEYTLTLENTMQISLSVDPSLVQAERQITVDDSGQNLALRIYTSGSTGTAKIVQLSHLNLVSNTLAAYRITTLSEHDRFISLLPFSHTMGLLANMILPYYCGSLIVSPRMLAAAEILCALSEEKITVMVAVPRLFRKIMQGLQKRIDDSRLLQWYAQLLKITPLYIRRVINAPIRRKLGGNINAWISGGSHLDGDICKYFHHFGIPLRQGYGLTETSSLTSIQDEFDDAIDSVGKPVTGVSVKTIANGELVVKGPNTMVGYEDAQQMAEAIEDSWFKTGDIATIDTQGRITLTGRLKRIIVTEAGKNIYPEELEILLERDHTIKEAGVFELNKKPACILAIDDENADQLAKQCINQFNSIVSPHNRITQFVTVDELPRTPLGKIALSQLAEIFAERQKQ